MTAITIPPFVPIPAPRDTPSWEWLIDRYMAGRNFSQPPTTIGHVPVQEIVGADEAQQGVIDRLARHAVHAWLDNAHIEGHIWWLTVHKQPVREDLLAVKETATSRYKVAVEAWRAERFKGAMFGERSGGRVPQKKTTVAKPSRKPAKAGGDFFDDFG